MKARCPNLYHDNKKSSIKSPRHSCFYQINDMTHNSGYKMSGACYMEQTNYIRNIFNLYNMSYNCKSPRQTIMATARKWQTP